MKTQDATTTPATETQEPAAMTFDPIATQNEERKASMAILDRARALAETQTAREAERAANPKSKQNREAKNTEPRTTPCLCGCDGIPKGRKTRYLPGHDAKHLHELIAAMKATETPVE